MKKKVVIIGSGYGGLSAAALLSRDGFDVTVLEKNDQVGGRASIFREKGFSFDMGPSWYLMPDAFERFFAEFGKKPEDYLKLTRLDPSYRIFFGPDDLVDIQSDLAANQNLFAKLEGDDARSFNEYLKTSEYQYNVAMKDFVYKDFTKFRQFFTKQVLVDGRKLHVFENLDKYARRFFKNERARKILQYNIVFLGGAPTNTPALYSIMAHIDFHLGVWYPEGGMNAVAKAVEKLALDNGAKIQLNTNVESIIVEDGKATGVKTKDGTIKADIVVSGADYQFTETKLLAPEYQTYRERFWEKSTIAPSAFILYLGINKKIEKLQHHNLFLDNDWEKHFDAIFKDPEWPKSPSYYVCAPSKTDATVAPAGQENLFFLVPVAAGLEDNEQIRETYKEKIISHLEGLLKENIRDHIVVSRTFAHNDFSNMFNSYKGTALGLSHTLRQTAIFRPRRQSKKVPNLYYTGQYTHPGIGVPMCLISSQILANQLKQDA